MPSCDSSLPLYQTRRCGEFLFVEFPSGRRLAILGWPILKAWVKHPFNDDGWRPCQIDLDVTTGMVGCQTVRVWENPVVNLRARLSTVPHAAAMKEWEKYVASLEPVRQYFGTTPPNIRNAVSGYTSGQWSLLRFAAQGGDRAVELMKSNPALAYLVASSYCDSHLRDERIASLLRRRRRQIVGGMALPPTNAAVKVLAKVPAEHCRVRWLTVLGRRLTYPQLGKCLLHLPVINAAVMRTLCATPALRSVTPSLLVELSQVEGDPEAQIRFGQLLEEASELYACRTGNSLPSGLFKSVGQLTRFVERLKVEEKETDTFDLQASEFPPPPIAAAEAIHPLDTPDRLTEEAEELSNCALSYWREVVSNERYLYRLLAPERATILLVREKNRWALEELAGMRNRAVSGTSRQVVEEWLAKQPPFTEGPDDP